MCTLLPHKWGEERTGWTGCLSPDSLYPAPWDPPGWLQEQAAVVCFLRCGSGEVCPAFWISFGDHWHQTNRGAVSTPAGSPAHHLSTWSRQETEALMNPAPFIRKGESCSERSGPVQPTLTLTIRPPTAHCCSACQGAASVARAAGSQNYTAACPAP